MTRAGGRIATRPECGQARGKLYRFAFTVGDSPQPRSLVAATLQGFARTDRQGLFGTEVLSACDIDVARYLTVSAVHIAGAVIHLLAIAQHRTAGFTARLGLAAKGVIFIGAALLVDGGPGGVKPSSVRTRSYS
mgnify:CR=1 FL=1